MKMLYWYHKIMRKIYIKLLYLKWIKNRTKKFYSKYVKQCNYLRAFEAYFNIVKNA